MDKNQARLRRARQTRLKIRELRIDRLSVFRSSQHIYANITAADGSKVLVAASTNEPEVRARLASEGGKGSNASAAKLIGQRIAEKALQAGIVSVAFDRAGYRYHGRVRALAEAAREAGLKF